jgi:hypothetical protein
MARPDMHAQLGQRAIDDFPVTEVAFLDRDDPDEDSRTGAAIATWFERSDDLHRRHAILNNVGPIDFELAWRMRKRGTYRPAHGLGQAQVVPRLHNSRKCLIRYNMPDFIFVHHPRGACLAGQGAWWPRIRMEGLFSNEVTRERARPFKNATLRPSTRARRRAGARRARPTACIVEGRNSASRACSLHRFDRRDDPVAAARHRAHPRFLR